MADCEITSVYAGVAGGHIRAFNSHGVVAVKDREVREGDVKRVIDAAKAVAIPMDREVIHVIPQEFIIDDQEGIREPLGMSGVRLEAKIHIVTAAVTSAQNIVKCCNKAGLNVIDIVLEPLASAAAVLPDDERELGVCLIDIGGGTTDIAVFGDGAIKNTSVLGLGGYHLSNDIAVGLRTPFEEAERIKKKFGVASARFLSSRRHHHACPSVGGRKPREISRKILCEIIEPRVEEILSLARQELIRADLLGPHPVGRRADRRRLGAGRHRASSRRRSSSRRCARDCPRRSADCRTSCASPMYSTGVGLVLFGLNQQRSVPRQPLPDPRRLDLRSGQAADARVVLRRVRLKRRRGIAQKRRGKSPSGRAQKKSIVLQSTPQPGVAGVDMAKTSAQEIRAIETAETTGATASICSSSVRTTGRSCSNSRSPRTRRRPSRSSASAAAAATPSTP